LKTRIRRSAGILTATLVSLAPLGLAAPARANPAPHFLGTFHPSTVGIPSTIRRGETFQAHTWIMQDSKDTAVYTGFSLQFTPPAGEATPTVQVSWLNPLTGHWQAETFGTGGTGYTQPAFGHYDLELRANLKLPPKVWKRVDFQVKFGSTTPIGKWKVYAEGVNQIDLVTPSGAQETKGQLNWLDPYTTVTVTR